MKRMLVDGTKRDFLSCLEDDLDHASVSDEEVEEGTTGMGTVIKRPSCSSGSQSNQLQFEGVAQMPAAENEQEKK